MVDSIRKTLSHATVYGIGNAAQGIVGFLMLPIYTRYLSPADYGVVSMMQIVLDLTSLVFGMQIATAVFRNYYQEKEHHARNAVLSTALGFTVISKGAGSIALCLASTPAAILLFGDDSFEKYIGFFAFALLTESLSFIPFQYVRLMERPYLFVALSLVKLFVQFSLNFYFIVILERGVFGVIYSSVLSGALVGGGMSLWLMTQVGIRMEWRRANALVAYSWPLILSGFIGIYLTAGNRIALTRYHGLTEVGLLSLATQFSMVLRSMIWKPFNQVWGPQRFRLAQAADGNEMFQRGFILVTAVLVASATSIALFSEDIIALMATGDFQSASAVIPILVLAEVIRCITLFANTPLLVSGKTVELLYSSCVSAAVFTAALLVLVPAFSIRGAALASLLNALVAMWWITRKARKQLDLGLPWGKFWIAVVAASVVVLISGWAPEDRVASVAFKLPLLAILLVGIYYSPIVGKVERARFNNVFFSIATRNKKL